MLHQLKLHQLKLHQLKLHQLKLRQLKLRQLKPFLQALVMNKRKHQLQHPRAGVGREQWLMV
jgi:hypothetical protein